MTTAAATFSKRLRTSRSIQGTFSRPGYLRRIRYYIEHSDWDERILAKEPWLDKICGGIVIAAMLYLVPLVVAVFLR